MTVCRCLGDLVTSVGVLGRSGTAWRLSGGRRSQDRVECFLFAVGEVPVGLRDIIETVVDADDCDCEVAGRMAGVDRAAVLVVGEVAHVMSAVLDAPMTAHKFEQLVGTGVLRIKRGQCLASFLGDLTGLQGLGATLDPDCLAAPVEVAGIILLRVTEIDNRAAPALDAAVVLLQRFKTPVALVPVDGLEIVMHDRLIVLDGCHDIVGTTFVTQDFCRFLLVVHGVKRDRAPREVELSGEIADREDFVGLLRYRRLSEDDPAALLDRCDRHQPLVLNLL